MQQQLCLPHSFIIEEIAEFMLNNWLTCILFVSFIIFFVTDIDYSLVMHFVFHFQLHRMS